MNEMNKYKKILLGQRFVHACFERVFKGIRMHERENGRGENERVSEKDSKKGNTLLWMRSCNDCGVHLKVPWESKERTCLEAVETLAIPQSLSSVLLQPVVLFGH